MNLQPVLLAIIGCHASGKSTLGRRVAQAVSWRFDEELGETLRRQALRVDPKADATAPQAAFDLELWQLERARDLQRFSQSRVVETWHPGNLAYARKRSPTVASSLREAVRQQVASLNAKAVVQPLEIAPEVLRQRMHEPGPSADRFVPWLLEVGWLAQESARDLGLLVLPPLRTDLMSEDDATAEMVRRVKGLADA